MTQMDGEHNQTGALRIPPKQLEAETPRRRSRAEILALAQAWQVEDEPAYAYLLGIYLGDGHLLHRPPRTWTLRVACDPAYPAIEREIVEAMAATFPGARPKVGPRARGSADDASVTHPAIGRAFPQHGAGHKHLREITLEPWQLAVTCAHPAALIRGLIHSDGCRVVNRFQTRLPSGRVAEYSYVRYFFSNLSADIRGIFRAHCEMLGVRVTQPNHRNLAVSHRASVAILEGIVGPKA